MTDATQRRLGDQPFLWIVLGGLFAVTQGALVADDRPMAAIFLTLGALGPLVILSHAKSFKWEYWVVPIVVAQILFLWSTRVFARIPIPTPIYYAAWVAPIFLFRWKRPSRLTLALLGLVLAHFVLMALSLVRAPQPSDGIRYMMVYGLAVALGMSIPTAYDSLAKLRGLYWMLAFFGLIFLGSGLVDLLMYPVMEGSLHLLYSQDLVTVINDWHRYGRIVGLGVHPGILALQLTMLSHFALFFATNLRRGILAAVVLVLGLIVVLGTGNRMGLLIFVLGHLVHLVVRAGRRQVLIRLVFGTIALGVGALLASDVSVLEGVARLTTLGLNDVTVQSRFVLYDFAFDLLRANPLSGIGVMQFVPYTMRVPGEITHVHNIFLQMATEVGIPGLIVFLVLLVVAHLPDWWVHRNGDPEAKAYMLPLTAGSMMFLVNGLSGNPWYGSETLVLFWIVRGIALAVHRIALSQAARQAPRAGTPV